MYLFRASPCDPLVPHNPELHGYACNYIGGDSGPEVRAEDYHLYRDLGMQAVFVNWRTRKYHAAIRIGAPSMVPCGYDWQQEQAHIVLPLVSWRTDEISLQIGPFTFYDLLFALEAGAVTPREAIVDGYFGDAVFSLLGHVQPLECESPEAALALLALLSAAQK